MPVRLEKEQHEPHQRVRSVVKEEVGVKIMEATPLLGLLLLEVT